MARTDTELKGFLKELKAQLRQSLKGVHKALKEETKYISSLWRGKFLRSKMAYYTFKALKKDIGRDWERLAVEVSKGVEIIHLASLIHDDILDKGKVRRGKECFHLVFGTESALVWGDYLFALGQGVFPELGMSAVGSYAVRIVCEGQLLEEKMRDYEDLTLSNYMDVISRKTAYLFQLPAEGLMELGITSAEPYARYAFDWGIVFQMLDDLSDLEEDLLAKKISLPVILLKEKDPSLVERWWQGKSKLRLGKGLIADLIREGCALVEEIWGGVEPLSGMGPMDEWIDSALAKLLDSTGR